MPAPTSSPKTRQLTPLQQFFTKGHPCFLERMPTIRDADLCNRVKNCVPRSDNNNDLLEFIGDRAVNLFTTVFVGEPQRKLGNAHHQLVAALVSNNDTLGRLAHCLHLDRDADMLSEDHRAVDGWHPFLASPPPKVLADLFEAHIGAILLDQGRDVLYRWLRMLFEPIVKAATGGVFNNVSAERIFGEAKPWRPNEVERRNIFRLKRHMEDRVWKRVVRDLGYDGLDRLPSSTKFRFDSQGQLQEPNSGYTQVAGPLLNMWICEIVLDAEPQYQYAVAKAAHIFSNITALVNAPEMLAHVAFTVHLDDICSSTGSFMRDNQRATALKAMIGKLYAQDPEQTDRWGKEWLRPVILGAHDILTEQSRFQPVMPSISKPAPKKAPTPEPSKDEEEEEDALAALIKGMGAIDIKGKTASKGTRRVVLKAADGTALADALAAPLHSAPKKQARWKPIDQAAQDESTKENDEPAAESHDAKRGADKENGALDAKKPPVSVKPAGLGSAPAQISHDSADIVRGMRKGVVSSKTSLVPAMPRALRGL